MLPAVPHAAAVPGVAAVEMFERIRSAFRLRQQRVRLVATAALTNVALLLTLFPTVVERDMVEVVLMGGCLGVGNTGAVTEFNIQTDPEAARIVFESGVRLVMVPLEVTHQVCGVRYLCTFVRGWAERACRRHPPRRWSPRLSSSASSSTRRRRFCRSSRPCSSSSPTPI